MYLFTAAMNSVKKIDIRVEETNLAFDIMKIVEILRPEWNEDGVMLRTFTEGLSNILIGVHYGNVEKMLLFKVFGEKTDRFIDRHLELRNFELLSSNGYIPPLVATFVNGFVYHYIPGSTLNVTTVRDISVYPLVAKMLAKFHKLNHGPDITKVPLLWEVFDRFFGLIPSHTTDERFLKYFPNGLPGLKEDMEMVLKDMKDVKSPVVLCHNDLLLANIIYDGEKISFIDYEYACYNYQAFDIANHFSEFSGVSDFDPALYPNMNFQCDWIRYYLEEYLGTGNVKIGDICAVYEAVRRFHPVTHFFWAVWSVMQHFNSNVNFDYVKYASQKYTEFKKYRHDMGPGEPMILD